MPETIIKKHRFENFKHSHAYDEWGSYINREDGLNDGRAYYFDKNKQVKLIFKTSKKGNIFWAALPNQVITLSNGKKYDFSELENKISETYEHRKFKGDIVKNKVFTWKGCNVHLKEAQEECRIEGSFFRSDVSGILEDGTPCIVEIIKTSDLSQKKKNYINKNQLLTFKIYIDEYGNQEFKRDSIIGNSEIERITESIQKGEGELAELRREFKEDREDSKKVTFERIDEFKERVYRGVVEIRRKIRAIQEKIERYDGGRDREIRELGIRINYQRGRIQEQCGEIERVESESAIIEGRIKNEDNRFSNTQSEIKRLEMECKTLESTFIQAASRCKVKWYCNSWIAEPPKADRLRSLMYWTS